MKLYLELHQVNLSSISCIYNEDTNTFAVEYNDKGFSLTELPILLRKDIEQVQNYQSIIEQMEKIENHIFEICSKYQMQQPTHTLTHHITPNINYCVIHFVKLDSTGLVFSLS